MVAKIIQRFLHDETGATAIEYGLLAALISVAIIATLLTVGGQIQTTFKTIATTLTGANAAK